MTSDIRRPPDNRDVAELLAIESERAVGHQQRAFRRASRQALNWPVEVRDLVDEERPLEELRGIGPFLASRIRSWIDDEVEAPGPPPIRASFLTFAGARREVADVAPVLGDLQMHTTWSDGGSSVRRMADAAIARRYEYIAITDHSAGLRIVKGLDEEGLDAQALEIARTNTELEQAGVSLRILRSIEMNLNPHGEGDVDPGALRKLDLVLGSFHSSLRRTDEQTERYLAALAHPELHILGHPRGRIYNFRLGLAADWPRVFARAAELDKAVEIDAYPDRQDLDVDRLRLAVDADVRISIGTDAHSHDQLEWIDLGVAAAIEAGVQDNRIVNRMTLDELLDWVDSLRSRAA